MSVRLLEVEERGRKYGRRKIERVPPTYVFLTLLYLCGGRDGMGSLLCIAQLDSIRRKSLGGVDNRISAPVLISAPISNILLTLRHTWILQVCNDEREMEGGWTDTCLSLIHI